MSVGYSPGMAKRTVKIYPASDRMVANPDYRVRYDPRDPRKILPAKGATVPWSDYVARLIRAGDVETRDQRAVKKTKSKSKVKK